MGGKSEGRRLTLAPGVQVFPFRELPGKVRATASWQGKSFVVTRAHGRARSLLIDSEAAGLLDEFRRPSTAAQALIRYCERRQIDAREELGRAYPILESLISGGYLVWVDRSRATRPPGCSFACGESLGDLIVLRHLQIMEDSEVYQVGMSGGRFGALKIEVSDYPGAAETLANEAAILEHLQGDPAPELLRAEEFSGRRYLLLEWCAGCDAKLATEEWRRRGGNESRLRLLRISQQIAGAYASLHQQGVLHGDVHFRNVLVGRAERVRLVDFGFARRLDDRATEGDRDVRAGVPLLFEPEYARALLDEEHRPVSEAGEQYAIAALLYQLITGAFHLDFDLAWPETLRQIIESPPIGFADRGLEPWPEMEEVLFRGLEKEPERRFRSVEKLAERLAAMSPSTARRAGEETRKRRSAQPDQLVRELLDEVEGVTPSLDRVQLAPPQGSLYLGAAGVALALCSIGSGRGDARQLALADEWARLACDEMAPNGASSGDLDGRQRSSLWMGLPGAHLVRARVAEALGQRRAQAGALEDFCESTGTASASLDLLDGRAGLLLGCAALFDVGADCAAFDNGRLLEELWQQLRRTPSPADTVGDLGIAHGWVGYLYATLRWCRASGADLPPDLEDRLSQLADLAQPAGRGLLWPWHLPVEKGDRPFSTPGWCNGSAGYVLLWILAAEALPDATFLELAIGSGWNSWESSQEEGSLCCGLVGRAYALLGLHRVTGEALWLDRAMDLMQVAAAEGRFDDQFPLSLYTGKLGLALLIVELENRKDGFDPLFAGL
jgi:serine/threonine-protein kinase